jgi:hypothetical protein
MKYRKKPVVIDATQWFKNGDHAEVAEYTSAYNLSEKAMKENDCVGCGRKMGTHGYVDTLEGGHIVCPGDWIITGVKGEHYPCKPDIFEATYEKD